MISPTISPVIIFKRSLKHSKRERIDLGTPAVFVSFSTRMTIREYFKACNAAGVQKYAK